MMRRASVPQDAGGRLAAGGQGRAGLGRVLGRQLLGGGSFGVEEACSLLIFVLLQRVIVSRAGRRSLCRARRGVLGGLVAARRGLQGRGSLWLRVNNY
jgi:hypothetical protein